ncbi:uncharacterized protein N7482_005793 [Penicillium canariense]|uniref:Uncharacterized protein n=1 Tax=Penicillium canariense TaxID=189055 RepID=A0A9W9I8P7_9EURO|nr:uncharacterized protein N7482_005793 [Penicillium canariense]KAJ5167012.1 hypothetical protein N7482_005793 [Penicillium canariense]
MGKRNKGSKRNLRPSIHAPQHLGDDGSELSASALLQSIRQAREKSSNGQSQEKHDQPTPSGQRQNQGRTKPYIPEFDPTLPPAAFPTLTCLGQPVPQGTREGHLRRIKEDRERRLQGLEPFPREPYRAELVVSTTVESGPLSISELSNQKPAVTKAPSDVEYESPEGISSSWKASNTVHNPIYARNLAIMAGEDQRDRDDAHNPDGAMRSDMDLSDSEPEDSNAPKAAVPEWGELRPSLRAEIMDNLLDQGTWDEAVEMLGITFKQQNKVKEHLKRFHKVIKREGKQLEKMRNKQLRHLLNIDSSQKRSVPDQLILRRLAHKSRQPIIDGPDRHLLLCKSGELRAAWRFLKEHGLPLELAGVWSNGLEDMRRDEGEPATKHVKWRLAPIATLDRPIMATNAGLETQLPMSRKVQAINSVGRGGFHAPPAQQQHPMKDMKKYWDDWEELFTEPDETFARLAHERRLQLAFDADGAAQIMANPAEPALPNPAVAQVRYNQRIQRAKREAEAERRARARDPLPFSARDITEGTWKQKLKRRYDKLANDCMKLGLSVDSRSDVEYDENSELDEDALDALLAEASQFNEVYRCLLPDSRTKSPLSDSQGDEGEDEIVLVPTADPDVRMR